jgi:hypothetical protein
VITLPIATLLRGLGQAVTYTKGTAKTIQAIFIRPYESTEIGGMITQTAAPRAAVGTTDVTGVDRTATLTISAVVYKVVEVRDLGNGLTELILSKD